MKLSILHTAPLAESPLQRHARHQAEDLSREQRARRRLRERAEAALSMLPLSPLTSEARALLTAAIQADYADHRRDWS